jgi:hypothetical protein
MGGVDFGGSQSHSMYLRSGGGYVGPGTKVEAYDSQRDTLATTEVLAKDETEDGAKEASDLIDGDYGALQRGTTTAALCSVNLGKGVGEGSACQQARHDTLVISEEEESRASCCCDGPVQGLSDKNCHVEEYGNELKATEEGSGEAIRQQYL